MIDIETHPSPSQGGAAEEQPKARILVLGVGGAGCNAVDAMIRSELKGVDYVVINTDSQALGRSICSRRLQIGKQITRGLGAGAKPEVGRDAALEDRDRIEELVTCADMVFVAAGMGGGTGTGAAPVVAEIARKVGALTVGVVTRPFQFEGTKRIRRAEQGIQQLKKVVDALITIPNNRLISMSNNRTTAMEAFAMADEVLVSAVRGVTDVIHTPFKINADFADLRTTLTNQGDAIMGVGEASGEHRAEEATRRAVNNPLLDGRTLAGAKAVLLCLAGGTEVSMFEVHEVCSLIEEEAHPDAELIWGWTVDPTLEDRLRVTVIATGFEDSGAGAATASPEQTLNRRVRAMSGREAPYRRFPGGAGELVSGIPAHRDEYDVPSFVRNID